MQATKIKVSQESKFRAEVARAIVGESRPGYQGGYHYADPVSGRVYRKAAWSPWSPWMDSVDDRIVAVGDLVDQDNSCFSPEVDWDVANIPYRKMAIAYLQSEGEDLEANGDVPEWVRKSDVIAFARDRDEWKELIEQIESDSCDEAIAFALREIKDEIVIEERLV